MMYRAWAPCSRFNYSSHLFIHEVDVQIKFYRSKVPTYIIYERAPRVIKVPHDLLIFLANSWRYFNDFLKDY